MLTTFHSLALLLLATFAPAPPPVQGPGTGYCYGVGCPCANDDATAGCINSSGFGARLEVTGSNSVSQDDTVFTATQLSPSSVCLLIVGAQNPQVPFSNGLRCVGGFMRRSVQHLNSGSSGSVTFNGVVSRYAAVDLDILPGDTWYFQVWFRDVPSSQTPCNGSANLTNAYAITFAP